MKPKRHEATAAKYAARPEGRPTKEVDVALMRRAASIGCTIPEIAALLGMGESTFQDKLAQYPELKPQIEEAREEGKGTLRRMQWQGANKGNPAMLIWLGKQMLGQKDKTEIAGDKDHPLIIYTGVPRRGRDA